MTCPAKGLLHTSLCKAQLHPRRPLVLPAAPSGTEPALAPFAVAIAAADAGAFATTNPALSTDAALAPSVVAPPVAPAAATHDALILLPLLLLLL